MLHCQKRSKLSGKLAMVLHAGSQDTDCKKPSRKNIDKGQVGRKTGLRDIFHIERVFVICYVNILFQLHEMIVNKALTNEKILQRSRYTGLNCFS